MKVVSWFSLSVLSMGFTGVAHAEVAPDPDYDERRAEVLEGLAAAYDPGDATGSSCVSFGFSAMYLAATLRAGELGLQGGATPEQMADDIEALANNAVALVGTGGQAGPCSWESAGSPAALHGALGLGIIVHEWGEQLPADVRDAIFIALEQGAWRESIAPYLVNGNLSLVAGFLLGGEALGDDSELWARGMDILASIYERTRYTGGLEMNSPTYTHYHYAALAPLMLLDDEEARAMARILLEYELTVQAHLYLPGGGLGAPQSRDRQGGASDGTPSGMHRMLAYLTGDDPFEPATNVHTAGPAIAGYELPLVLRSIFLDKGEGYELWGYTDAPVEASRMPYAVYPFLKGTDTGDVDALDVTPWQAVVLPGGEAMLGISHGARFQAIHVSMGLYASNPDGDFSILYQLQPFVDGDTHDGGGSIPSSNGDDDPDDFLRELYDYERFMVGRTLVSIWDPTLALKDDGVVRQVQQTRVHLPDYAALGGEITEAGPWSVARLGDVFIGYLPLGTIVSDTLEDGYRYLHLDGRSGGVYELATIADFPSLDDYAAHLAERFVSFETDPLAAEVDALDPESGDAVRLRIEYRPERRFIDGVEISVEDALDHGWLASPWIETQTDAVTLERECYPRVTYDWEGRAVSEVEAPADCDDPGGGTGGTDGGGSTTAEGTDGGGTSVGPSGTGGSVPDGTSLGSTGGAGTDTSSASSGGGSGCGCRAVDRSTAGGWAWLLLSVGLYRRRRSPGAMSLPPLLHGGSGSRP